MMDFVERPRLPPRCDYWKADCQYKHHTGTWYLVLRDDKC